MVEILWVWARIVKKAWNVMGRTPNYKNDRIIIGVNPKCKNVWNIMGINLNYKNK